MPNIPAKKETTTEKVKKFFNEYYSAPLEFPSNEVDAVVGFFEARGFEKLSAQTIGAVLMKQAKLDDIKVFEMDIENLDQVKEAVENIEKCLKSTGDGWGQGRSRILIYLGGRYGVGDGTSD